MTTSQPSNTLQSSCACPWLKPIETYPVVAFCLGFLHNPHHDFWVDWDRTDAGTPLLPDDEASYQGNEYMAGMLVKHLPSGTVWRLTGEGDDDGMIAKWPD